MMPTTKEHSPITISPEESLLRDFTNKQKPPFSQIIAPFTKEEIKQMEDKHLSEFVDKLHEENHGFLSHEAFWKKALLNK